MSLDPQSDEQFTLTLSDIWRLCKRYKRKIIAGALIMGSLGGLFALISKVEYKVEGSFREKTPKPINLGNTLAAAFMNNAGIATADSEAIAYLKSRRMIEKVIQKLHLQGNIYPSKERDTYIKRIKENLLVQMAYLSRTPFPMLKDCSKAILAKDVNYQGETPLVFQINFQPDQSFEVIDSLAKRMVGIGRLNQPFEQNHYRFTLIHSNSQPILSEPYHFIILPLSTLAANLSRQLQIEADRTDKNLLRLSFRDRNRHFACHFLNALMTCYQDYLKETHDNQASIQLEYLHKRQEESGEMLSDLMRNHAAIMSQDFSTSGFADAKREMEFLAASQHEFKEKLIANELEIKRLQNVQTGECVYYDYHGNEGNSRVINTVLENIRQLKQQRDVLELALKTSDLLDTDALQTIFEQQIDELRTIQSYLNEIDSMIDNFTRGQPLDFAASLMQDNRFLIKAWYERLTYFPDSLHQKVQTISPERNEEFLAYLHNLKRMFHVYEKIIQERLTHQQNPSLEFQGVKLKTVEELYMTYTKNINDLESQVQHYQFVIQQINDPYFEISSLGTVLTDSISQDMIRQAGQLLLQLRDENNRTAKEQDRIKAELALQKNFIISHLTQHIQLSQLSQKVLKEKIFALQNVTLELIHQEISLLEKNLNDYIYARLNNLRQERHIIEQHMDELHQEMAKLPTKWVSEQMIQQRLETNQFIVEEIAKLVESRNITHNLEVIQSAPIDSAIPPIHPLPSNVILSTILGAMLGSCFSVAFLLTRAMIKGIPATKDNIKSQGQHVAGELSPAYRPNHPGPLRDQDLETMRRLQAYFNENLFQSPSTIKPSGQLLLLIEGNGPDYANDLARLWTKQGQKVVTLSLSFEGQNDEPGLFQYLEGNASFPHVAQDAYGDHIAAGAFSRFSTELLLSQTFSDLIDQLKTKYDWIIAKTQSLPATAEAESLIQLFPSIAVTVSQETLPQLQPYLKLKDQADKHVSFIFFYPYYYFKGG